MFKEIVDNKIFEARKSRNEVELTVWQSIKDKLSRFETAKERKPLTEAAEIGMIYELINQHRDSIVQFTEGGRKDLASKEQKELDILVTLVPDEPTKDDIKNVINEVLEEIRISNGGSYNFSMRDMKTVQANVKMKYPSVDGSTIAEIFKKMI